MNKDGVFRRKDSRSWWVCYSVAGRTLRESAKTEKKGEAIEFRRRVHGGDAGVPPPSGLTFYRG